MDDNDLEALVLGALASLTKERRSKFFGSLYRYCFDCGRDKFSDEPVCECGTVYDDWPTD